MFVAFLKMWYRTFHHSTYNTLSICLKSQKDKSLNEGLLTSWKTCKIRRPAMSPRLDAMIPRLNRLHRSKATTSVWHRIIIPHSKHQNHKPEANETVINLGLSCWHMFEKETNVVNHTAACSRAPSGWHVFPEAISDSISPSPSTLQVRNFVTQNRKICWKKNRRKENWKTVIVVCIVPLTKAFAALGFIRVLVDTEWERKTHDSSVNRPWFTLLLLNFLWICSFLRIITKLKLGIQINFVCWCQNKRRKDKVKLIKKKMKLQISEPLIRTYSHELNRCEWVSKSL